MYDVLINGEQAVFAVNDVTDSWLGKSATVTTKRSRSSLSSPGYEVWSFVASSSRLGACTPLESPHTTTETGNIVETATKSITFSSTITIVDFALQRQWESAKLALEQRQALVESQAYDNDGFCVILAEVRPELLMGLSKWIDTETASSCNTFLVYPGVLMMDEVELWSWQRSKQLAVILYHPLAERFSLFPSDRFALFGMRSQTEGWHGSSKQAANSLKSKNARV